MYPSHDMTWTRCHWWAKGKPRTLMPTITRRCVLSHTQKSTDKLAQRCPGPKLISICCWWWQCDTWHDWAKGSLVSWGKALLHRTSGAHARMHSGALSCVHPSTLSQGTVRPSTLTGLDSSQNALSYPKTCAPCTGSQRDFSCNFCSIWWIFLWHYWIFWGGQIVIFEEQSDKWTCKGHIWRWWWSCVKAGENQRKTGKISAPEERKSLS